MNTKPPNRELERVSYWEGQMLRSADFLDIQRVEAERRWWHNRAVHNAYGVYQGFEAKTGAPKAGKSSFIVVTPGIAYDCYGRELFLECAATIEYSSKPIPKGNFRTLLVRYKKPGPRRETHAVAAVCCFCDGKSATGDIEFVWLDRLATRQPVPPQCGVPLGEIRALGIDGGRFTPLIAAPRQRPFSRPRIATGSTIPGNTVWQPWDYSPFGEFFESEVRAFQRQIIEIGVQTTVDTSAAGFTDQGRTQYFAWLEGPFFNPQTLQLVPALLPSLANEALDSFTFRLILMKDESHAGAVEVLAHTIAPKLQLIQASADFAQFAQAQGLYVSWLGCQMPEEYKGPRKIVSCTSKFSTEYERRGR